MKELLREVRLTVGEKARIERLASITQEELGILDSRVSMIEASLSVMQEGFLRMEDFINTLHADIIALREVKMTKPIVIGIVGPKQSGKSTAARMMSEFVDIHEVALADKLKNVCAKVFKIPRITFDSQDLKEVPFSEPIILSFEQCTGILDGFKITQATDVSSVLGSAMRSPREIAQTIGTGLLRNLVDPNIHINSIGLNYAKVNVICDTRFLNELEVFQKRNDIQYYPIYIYRKEKEDMITPESHISERELLSFKDRCHVIDNNGSIRQLESNVKAFLDDLLTKK